MRAYFQSKICQSFWMVCDVIDGEYFPVGEWDPWEPTRDYVLQFIRHLQEIA